MPITTIPITLDIVIASFKKTALKTSVTAGYIEVIEIAHPVLLSLSKYKIVSAATAKHNSARKPYIITCLFRATSIEVFRKINIKIGTSTTKAEIAIIIDTING